MLLGRQIKVIQGSNFGLDAERERLNLLLGELVEKTAPQLLEIHGVGVDTTATLLVTAGDKPLADPLRGRLGASLRRCTDPGFLRKGEPRPARSRR